METHQIVQQWYSIATSTTDEPNSFFRFIALWVAFNGLYAARHRNASGDKNKVLQFAGESRVINHHRELLQTDSNYHQAVLVLQDQGVLNLQNRRREKISATDNLVEVMTCVYTVRCNLFHGDKAPLGARNEQLVRACHTIISQLITPYVGEWN